MSIWIWVLIIVIAAALLVAAGLRVRYELHQLQYTFYEIESEKIRPEDSIRAVFLADLHGRRYGEENEDLIRMVSEQAPDAIFVAGDMITSSYQTDFDESARLFRNLTQIAPVYFAAGNHEKRMAFETSPLHPAFQEYREKLADAGVVYMKNTREDLNPSLTITGLDIDFHFYHKVVRQNYTLEQMKEDIEEPDRTRFNIVLSHNPRFFKTYSAFGADLFLAGHYHGGAVRIGRKIGVISPQFRPFPKYSGGMYKRNGTVMIVTRGCGSHKVNLRLFNKPEIVVIDLHGHII